MADLHKITFLPAERVLPVEPGQTILDVAMAAGIHINASCGGNGACGKCRVVMRNGAVVESDHPGISQEDYRSGVRLACQTHPLADVVVEIP